MAVAPHTWPTGCEHPWRSRRCAWNILRTVGDRRPEDGSSHPRLLDPTGAARRFIEISHSSRITANHIMQARPRCSRRGYTHTPTVGRSPLRGISFPAKKATRDTTGYALGHVAIGVHGARPSNAHSVEWERRARNRRCVG
jgi:hypothetical protein